MDGSAKAPSICRHHTMYDTVLPTHASPTHTHTQTHTRILACIFTLSLSLPQTRLRSPSVRPSCIHYMHGKLLMQLQTVATMFPVQRAMPPARIADRKSNVREFCQRCKINIDRTSSFSPALLNPAATHPLCSTHSARRPAPIEPEKCLRSARAFA